MSEINSGCSMDPFFFFIKKWCVKMRIVTIIAVGNTENFNAATDNKIILRSKSKYIWGMPSQ